MEVLKAAMILWVLPGVLAYGMTLYAFQTKFPAARNSGDVAFALLMGMLGLFGVVVAVVCIPMHNQKFGLQFLPKPPEPW